MSVPSYLCIQLALVFPIYPMGQATQQTIKVEIFLVDNYVSKHYLNIYILNETLHAKRW